jgi:hypothetical protein
MLTDRIGFKLYSAERHLNRLKEIENAYGDIAKVHIRIEVEMEIDCFLSQLVEAVDCLLSEINERLDLGIPRNRLNFADVQSALIAKTKKIDLLSSLDAARQQGGWFHLLGDLRNQSIRRPFLSEVTSASQSSSSPKASGVRFLIEQSGIGANLSEQLMNMEPLSYLEKSLNQVRETIFAIRENEALLRY